MKKSLTIVALSALAAFSASAAPYTVSFKSGKFPKDVTVSNANGLLPNSAGYKRGYTADGWIVDRLGSRGYVALSPTYTRHDDETGEVFTPAASKNIMTLPEIAIQDGDVLRWEGRSVHPDFLETYRVTATVDGVSEIIAEVVNEDAEWTMRMVDLSKYSGKNVAISFECISECRYILAIDGILVGAPEDLNLQVVDNNQVYYDGVSAPDGTVTLAFDITNMGASLKSGVLELDASYELSGEYEIKEEWATGETRTLTFEVASTPNKRAPYELYYRAESGNPILLGDGNIFLSDFEKKFIIDKGTGMWCVNCPDGVVLMEKLKRQFGDGMILLDTHHNDLLANDAYFSALAFRAIPWMMLNRIPNSSSSNTDLFTSYYYKPVSFGVRVSEIKKDGDGSAEIGVLVRSSEAVDNTAGRYRVGYVLTGEFYNPDKLEYYQKNSVTGTMGEQYYYLPSLIPAPLVKFHHVTLTFDGAFDGIEGSLPAAIEPGKDYYCRFNVECPQLLENIGQADVTVYVLDTETGEVLNANRMELKNDYSGVEDIRESFAGSGVDFTVSSDGRVVRFRGSEGNVTVLDVYSISGQKMTSITGMAGKGSIELQLVPGIYVYRLTVAEGTASRKAIVK